MRSKVKIEVRSLVARPTFQIVFYVIFLKKYVFPKDKNALFSGGKPYYYSNEPGDNTLYDAFAATMERGEIDDHDRRVQVCLKSPLTIP